MPLYEYECPNRHKFEILRPMDRRNDLIHCSICRGLGRLLMSRMHWSMGWNFLKEKSRESPPAPTDSGYHPEWDQAYRGPQVVPKASIPK